MTLPDIDEVLGYFDSLSNWGRWGGDDRLGTLNYVTPDVTRAAAAEIREGASVSCAWDIDNHLQEGDIYGPPQRYMLHHGQGLGDEHRAEACASRHRWTFFMHLSPLRLAGATGSPLNPIASF
jgi:hypothetical protein